MPDLNSLTSEGFDFEELFTTPNAEPLPSADPGSSDGRSDGSSAPVLPSPPIVGVLPETEIEAMHPIVGAIGGTLAMTERDKAALALIAPFARDFSVDLLGRWGMRPKARVFSAGRPPEEAPQRVDRLTPLALRMRRLGQTGLRKVERERSVAVIKW